MLTTDLLVSEFNIQKAMERLSATIKWREEYKIESLLTETFPDDVFGKVGYVYGHDKGGRPLTYVISLARYPQS